jgi:hypothetical protein
MTLMIDFVSSVSIVSSWLFDALSNAGLGICNTVVPSRLQSL